jgi:hypothetical protein
VVDDAHEAALPNGKRKLLGQHVIVTGAAAPAPTPGATKRQRNPVAKKAADKKPAAKMAYLTALTMAMCEASSASVVVHRVLNKSPTLDDVP